MRRRLQTSLFCASLMAAALAACRKSDVPARAPSVRLYIMSTLAGAMEPCGCRKDMLGGIDHAAALLASEAKVAPDRLVLAAGPLFFQDPSLEEDRREQDVWKAQAIASSLADLGLSAWAPGVNDFAAGSEELSTLVSQSKARALGVELGTSAGSAGTGGASAGPAYSALFDVGKYKVGVAGVGASPGAELPAGAAAALERAAAELTRAGAQIRVALIAAPRGEGLRLAEKVPGFDVVALGKPVESGEANDGSFPPTLVGDTLVVQAPNHLQALAYVDLFVEGDDFEFKDGVGIAAIERRDGLRARVAELESRLARSGAGTEQRTSLEQTLTQARGELAEAERAVAAPKASTGSVFRYQEVPVRESLGGSPEVARRMSDYYRKVNEHNRVALADREPKPVERGEPRYVGSMFCPNCHGAATRFWEGTKHATAYETLTDQFKEYNLDCVGCHVTGYERAGGSTVTHVGDLKGVQCEACHGPASLHIEHSGNTRYITLTPKESVCRGCHQTPHVADDWDLAASWSKIIGKGHGEHPVGGPGVQKSSGANSSGGAAGSASPTGGSSGSGSPAGAGGAVAR